MAKKARQEKAKIKEQPKPVQPKKKSWYADRTQMAVITAILIGTFIVYLPCLSSTKEFTNWDDLTYVVHRPSITGLDGPHIHALFTEPVAGHYHPLTMLSLALNYHFSQLQPFGYFLTNIIFHLLNTFLVFLFLYRLSGKKFRIGAISALLFAIHPMHVESVAWISERKDVLYCFFFLASCISYLSYTETKQIKYVIICFVSFVLSCLSKPMAIPLPVVLLLIDFYRQRKFSAVLVWEKIPFFAVSVLLGLLAIHTQRKEEITDLEVFTIPQRIAYASYEFFMYWVKIFLPVRLSVIYPPPIVKEPGYINWLYKLTVPAVLILIAAPAFIFYKKDKEKFRLFVFGMGFFIAMVAIVLRVMVKGNSIMPDRYTYVSYIGPFFIFATFLQPYLDNAKTKVATLALLLMASAALAFTSYNRVHVWQNAGVLWTDVIRKNPYTIVKNGKVTITSLAGVENAYASRANYYLERGDTEKAATDYKLLVRLHTKNESPYSYLAFFYTLKGRNDTATALYTEALKMTLDELDTSNIRSMIYRNRSVTYSALGKHREALDDLMIALKLSPADSIDLHHHIALEKLKAKLFDESIADFSSLIAINANDEVALLWRGTALISQEKYSDAVNDLAAAVKLKPSLGNAWFKLSFCYKKLGNKTQALEAALNAKKNGYKVEEQYLRSLK